MVGILGVFRPIADGVKLLVKEPVLRSSATVNSLIHRLLS